MFRTVVVVYFRYRQAFGRNERGARQFIREGSGPMSDLVLGSRFNISTRLDVY